jgi:hypothetical protein
MAIEHPGKRSSPGKLRKEREGIVKDMESRLPPDAEDPESVQKRRLKFAIPPVVKGGMVIGFKKNNSPV